MELRHLQHFIAVAEEQNFTRAAARLHIVQSGLSVSIRTLERELGCSLFERTSHKVLLTDAGSAFLDQARKVLAAADNAREVVAAVQGGVRGTVRVGIMQSMVLVDLAELLARFRGKRPFVRVEPRTLPGGSSALVEAVGDGRLDVAFTALPTYERSLDVVPLTSADLVLALPPDHELLHAAAIRLEDLDGEQFVEFPPGWGTRKNVDRLFADHDLTREITVEVADIPTAVELVKSGFGMAFLIRSAIMDQRLLSLRSVIPSPMFEVSIITSNERAQSAATRAFTELVRQFYGVCHRS